MKKTDKLTKRQVLAIPGLVNKRGWSVGAVAGFYGVSWQAVWYWVKQLRRRGFEIRTRKKGSRSLLDS